MWKQSGQHRSPRWAIPAHGKFAFPSNYHEWPLYLVFLRFQLVVGTIDGRHSEVWPGAVHVFVAMWRNLLSLLLLTTTTVVMVILTVADNSGCGSGNTSHRTPVARSLDEQVHQRAHILTIS